MIKTLDLNSPITRLQTERAPLFSFLLLYFLLKSELKRREWSTAHERLSFVLVADTLAPAPSITGGSLPLSPPS